METVAAGEESSESGIKKIEMEGISLTLRSSLKNLREFFKLKEDLQVGFSNNVGTVFSFLITYESDK